MRNLTKGSMVLLVVIAIFEGIVRADSEKTIKAYYLNYTLATEVAEALTDRYTDSRVKPTIVRDERTNSLKVTASAGSQMDIEVEIGTFANRLKVPEAPDLDIGMPIIDTRQTETSMVVKDGETSTIRRGSKKTKTSITTEGEKEEETVSEIASLIFVTAKIVEGRGTVGENLSD